MYGAVCMTGLVCDDLPLTRALGTYDDICASDRFGSVARTRTIAGATRSIRGRGRIDARLTQPGKSNSSAGIASTQ